jgi:hypothetical protein
MPIATIIANVSPATQQGLPDHRRSKAAGIARILGRDVRLHLAQCANLHE